MTSLAFLLTAVRAGCPGCVTDWIVPLGTTDSSPRFQPWVAGGKGKSPAGTKDTPLGYASISAVPDGTRFSPARKPSDESLYLFTVVGTARCAVRAAFSGAS